MIKAQNFPKMTENSEKSPKFSENSLNEYWLKTTLNHS